MSMTASNLVRSVNNKIHGAKAKLGGDTEMYRILNEASVELRCKVNLLGSKRFGDTITIFKDIYEYPSPEDLEFKKVIDLIDEQDNTVTLDATDPKNIYRPGNNAGVNGLYAVEHEDSSSYLLVNTDGSSSMRTVSLNSCSSIDENGTWSISGDAINLSVDTQGYKTGSGSLRFDSGGVSSGLTVKNSTMTSVDISSMENLGSLFAWEFSPSILPDSVTLKWGSATLDYWEVQATKRLSGLNFKRGWNLLTFPWEEATKVGSPDSSAITYLEVTITNGSAVAQNKYRIDGILASMGVEVTPKYYSKYIVQNSTTGARKHEFETGDDISVLMDVENALLINEATIIALRELREYKEAAEFQTLKHEPKLEQYRQQNPSEVTPVGKAYYNMGYEG